MTISKVAIGAASLGAVLWISSVSAADPPGAKPGDEALTCDQIYAQGMAETQRDQQERAQRIAEQKTESKGRAALLVGAMAAGGMGGTGQAANAAMQSQATQSMSMLTPPPPNPRMVYLKQLWAQKHCVMKK